MAREEKSSVERLKGRLYARGAKRESKPQERTPLLPESHEAPVSWTDVHPSASPTVPVRPRLPVVEPVARMSFATKFLLGSILFFVLASGAAAFMFFGGGNIVSSRNIELEIVAPSLIDGGKEATLEFIITNRNRTALRLADLIIDYPDGTRDPKDPTRALSHERISIGTVESGQQLKQTASAVFFGSEGVQQKVHVALEYTITGSNAVFVKEDEVDFLIGSSPLSLSVEAPAEAVAGEPFPITIRVQSNAPTPVEHVLVEAQYPFGFSLSNSSPRADVGGLLWRLGTMEPGDTETIKITGVVDASEGDERVFRFLVGSDADETNTRIRVPFLSQPVSVTVKRPFIAGSISVEGKTGSAISVPAGESLQGKIEWENNLPDSISNLEFELEFDGPMLDEGSVNAQNGFYQSGTDTITWTKAQDPSLARVSPGEGGTLSFSFGTLPPGTGGTIYTNPTISLQLRIRATAQDEDGDSQTVTSSASAQVTIASNISLSAAASHFEGPFENSGPMPPKVEEDTTYGVTWSVRNSSNAIANAAVAAILPPYVEFLTGAPGSGVTYDGASRTVRWGLGDVAAGVGYSAPARTASFQVRLTPSSSQIGQVLELTGGALLSGQDRFAQVPVQASAGAPTTEIKGESDFKSRMGIVEP